jgi:hypothetical protein
MPQIAPIDPALMAGAVGEGAEPKIQVKVFLDSSEIRHLVTEEIEWNRTIGYQGFGGDPMGFNSGVAGP